MNTNNQTTNTQALGTQVAMPSQPVEMILTKWGWQMAPPGDKYVTGSLRKWGVYSDVEVKLLSLLLKGGDRAIVAGGNIGAVAIPLALNTGALVETFEPQPLLAQLLKANVAMARANMLVNVYNAGLGAKRGVINVPMIRFDCDYNMGAFGKNDWDKPHEEGVDVELVDFGEVFDKVKPNLVLLDVEGMEFEILNGIKDRLKAMTEGRPFLWVEDDRPEQHKDLMDFMRGVRYNSYWVITPLVPEGTDPAGDEWPMQCSFNLLCVPEESGFKLDGLREARVGDPVGNCPGDWMITGVGTA